MQGSLSYLFISLPIYVVCFAFQYHEIGKYRKILKGKFHKVWFKPGEWIQGDEEEEDERIFKGKTKTFLFWRFLNYQNNNNKKVVAHFVCSVYLLKPIMKIIRNYCGHKGHYLYYFNFGNWKNFLYFNPSGSDAGTL